MDNSVLNGMNQNFLLQKRMVMVRVFSGAVTNNKYDLIEPIFKRNPDCINLHIGTNDASSNLLSDEILGFKSFVTSN